MVNQLHRVTLTSRAFHNDVFPRFAEKVTGMFGYDMVLPMNTGTEAVETAVKIARAWAYKVKGVERGRALIFSAENGYHGRTVCVCFSGLIFLVLYFLYIEKISCCFNSNLDQGISLMSNQVS